MREQALPPMGMPRLDSGRHVGPELGGCLMEVVSVLAGEPWSDHPRCTHPTLSEVARLVTDGTSEPGRTALLGFAADLVGLGGRDARVTPALVALAVRYAGSDRWRARRDLAAARRRIAGLAAGGAVATWYRLTDPVYRRGPARWALARAAGAMSGGTAFDWSTPDPVCAADGDARLRALLVESLAVSRALLCGRPECAPVRNLERSG